MRFYLMAMRSVSGIFLFLLLLITPKLVLAHGGHGDEFHQETEANPGTQQRIQVDAQTVKRMGIEVKPDTKQQMDI